MHDLETEVVLENDINDRFEDGVIEFRGMEGIEHVDGVGIVGIDEESLRVDT